MRITAASVALVTNSVYCQPSTLEDWFALVGIGRGSYELMLACCFNPGSIRHTMHGLSNYHVVVL